MTHEELVAKVSTEIDKRMSRIATEDERVEDVLRATYGAVRIVVEACVEEIADCSCHGEDYCLCSCRRRIIALGGTR